MAKVSMDKLKKLIDEILGRTSKQTGFATEFPNSPTQVLRQLSANAGQMGMPGGYTGAVQLPAYAPGRTAKPVLNPDMRTYGQQPNMGEARFFTQSMTGGMTPIASMTPLGVPQNWNPLGANNPQGDLEKYIKDLLGKSGPNGGAGSSADQLRAQWNWPAYKKGD